MWENGELSRKRLDAAAAALSPGGKIIQEKSIPSSDLPNVRRTLRAAYRSLGVADPPKWVKDNTNRKLLTNFVPLVESQGDKGIAQVVVIRPGLNEDKDCYYPAEVLARDYAIFEGAKMYANHPTESEDRERPERSIRDWVATLKNVGVGSDGAIIGEAVVFEPWMKERLANLRDQNLLTEMGISINAVGTATEGKINDYDVAIIEQLNMARSVDFVTEPGAGGLVKIYEASKDVDVDLVGLEVLKNRRPDLVLMIESAVKAEIQEEVKQMEDLQAQLDEKDKSIATLTEERDALKERITEAEKAQQVAETKAKVDEALAGAELPDAAKVRLAERFKDAMSDEGLAEAITAEQDYIAAIKETGKVKEMGESKSDSEAERVKLKESLKRMNPTWTDEQLDIAVKGR